MNAEQIKKIIQNELSSSNIIIELNDNLDDLGVNSVEFIKIVVSIESAFDFEFDDEMLLITKFPTVRSMVEYVESKVNQL